MMGYYGLERNSGIPRLRTYKQALDWHNDTKPIRRRVPELRPLGLRRNTWYEIAKRDDNAIECKLSGTPIVTYLENGVIEIRNLYYNTTSTAHFIEDVLPVRANLFDHSIVIGIGSVEQRIPIGGCLQITQNEQGNYHFIAVGTNYTHKMNRKNIKAMKERFKPFTEYVSNLMKLRGDEQFRHTDFLVGLGIDNLNNALDLKHTRYGKADEFALQTKEFKNWISDESDDKYDSYYKALLVLANSFSKWDWQTQGRITTKERLIDGFNEALLGLFRDELLDATPTGNGLVKRDSYGTYFMKKWQTFYQYDKGEKLWE